jgi:catechol 2,3-dioxygenase-like lactoylglutathione lyase family enzyme
MLRFDHLVIAVRDLECAVAEFRDVLGFDAQMGGRHEAFGTRNAIARFGLDYLELISVEDERLALQSSRGALVRFLAKHQIGLCAYAVATDDLDSLASLALQVGIESTGPFAMNRRRPDGSRLSWRLLVPGGDQYFQMWPFFIQWDQPDSERMKMERAGKHPNGSVGVSGIEIGVNDLRTADAWYQSMGVESVSGFQRLLIEDSMEGPRAVTLRVQDLRATRDWYRSRSLQLEPAPGMPDRLCLMDGPLPGALYFTTV